jgi:hypothetical protein
MTVITNQGEEEEEEEGTGKEVEEIMAEIFPNLLKHINT